MVHAMIKWTGYLFAERLDAVTVTRRRWWGIAYAALWALIIGLFLRLLQRDGRLSWDDLGMLALVAGSFWTIQGLIVCLGRAITRANTRAAAAAARDDAAEPEAIGLAALGFVLLMAGALDMALSRGKPMSRREIEAMAQIHREIAMRPGTWGKATYRIRGTARGAEGEGQFSLAEIKAAWRTGAWRHSRRWQRMFAMGAGALGLLLGGFGIPFVLGTAGVKLLVLAVWGFVLFQVVRGFRRA